MKSWKIRILALLFAVLTAIGISLVVAPSSGASPYPTYARNQVENSGLSNAGLLVCGSKGKCITLAPGVRISESEIWNPTQVAVGAYQGILYRYVRDDYVGPWGDLQGGTTGTWLNIENLQNFFGQGGLVQVIINDPR